MGGKRNSPKKGDMASSSDRHSLYEQSVQNVEAEIDMVDATYRNLRGSTATLLREDFCGTANTSCEWVRRRHGNRAIGLDTSQEVLDWGWQHNVRQLDSRQRNRIQLVNRDVRDPHGEPVDIIIAMNFSYQLFKTRDSLRNYFLAAKAGLNERGMFMIDAYGGHESWRSIKEKTKHREFTYYWDQEKYDPVTGHALCHIHFKFPDGSKLNRAFTYDWRMWTLPELQEILCEAGFSNVTVYWEGTDEETGEGNGIYQPCEHGEDDPSWIVYLSGNR